MTSTFVYDAHENKKKVAALIHKYIHHIPDLVLTIMKGISDIDSILYSTETRAAIQSKLTPHHEKEDGELIAQLQTPESTRVHVYRFFIKGSNAMEVIMYHLERMYKNISTKFPMIYNSDWDTSILICPKLTPRQFNIVFEILVSIIQKQLIRISNTFSDIHNINIHQYIEANLDLVHEYMSEVPEYTEFSKYPLTYEKNKQSLIKVHDESKHNPDVIEYIKSLGLSAKGFFVTSNRTTSTSSTFYLGRILLSVRASRNVWLPVEIIDVSMNYQNKELEFAWESHSEYHIKHADSDFRVLSPTAMYIDLAKCLMNTAYSANKTKRKKIPARIQRINYILESMIIRYQNQNSVITENLERHTKSQTLVGNIRRRMNFTRKFQINNILMDDAELPDIDG
jgi:hypothetical protein